jgi:hypothetical protein
MAARRRSTAVLVRRWLRTPRSVALFSIGRKSSD